VPTLPDIKGKVVLDDSQLAKAGITATKSGAAIKGGMQAGQTGVSGMLGSVNSLLSRFGVMPPVLNQVTQSVEQMSSKGVQGMSGLTLAGGAVVAGLGILLAAGEEGIHMYTDLGGKVLAFSRATGASAEQSSRMVQVFEELNVPVDIATGAIVKLSRAVETTPKKLEELGIQIARDSKGNVDLTGTLNNVTKAYQSNDDAAQRNLIALTAFGRGGASLIPILAEDTAQLIRLEAQVQTIYTAADLKRIHDYQISQGELKRSSDDLGASIGQALLPAQMAAVNTANENIYVNEHLDAKMKELYGSTVPRSRLALMQASQALREEYVAAQNAQGSIDTLTKAHKDAADAAAAQAAAEDKLVSALEAQTNSAYGLKLADLAVSENAIHLREANDKVATATDNLATAQGNAQSVLKQYGYNTGEYQKALDQVTKAQDDLTLAQDEVNKTVIDNEKNVLAAAAAARRLQEDTDLAATGQKNAAKESQAYVDKLYAEQQALDPASPLRKDIQGYIDALGLIPTQITTQIQLKYDQGLANFKEKHPLPGGYAAGGRPPVGVPALVGEHGPELWTPDQPGTVTPQGGTPPPSPRGGDNLSVTVNAQSNADPHDIATESAWELRKMRRNF